MASLIRVNLLIASGTRGPWTVDLATRLKSLPVDLRWSNTDTEAVCLVVSRKVDAAVVDSGLPVAGGLDATRRIRRLGIDLPLLLVCNDPDERTLQDALALDVFTVVQGDANGELLASMLNKAVRRLSWVNWPDSATIN